MTATAEALDLDPRHNAPQRRCLASGAVRPRDELLRFVVAPDGVLVFDLAAKLPGRGLWLVPERALLARAVKRNLFAKAARRPVRLPDDLGAQVAGALRANLLGLLGLARRAGAVTLGFEKVRATLEAGQAALLLQAADAAPGGRDKLRALAAHRGAEVIERFTVAELSGALGRDNAVHVALAPGGLARRIAFGAGRLRGIEAAPDGTADADVRDLEA